MSDWYKVLRAVPGEENSVWLLFICTTTLGSKYTLIVFLKADLAKRHPSFKRAHQFQI